MIRYGLLFICGLLTALWAWAEYPMAYVGYPDARDLSLSPDGEEVVVLMTDFEFGIRQRRTWDNLDILYASTGDIRYTHDIEERVYLWVYWPFEDTIISQALLYEIGRRDVDIQPALMAINPDTGSERILYKGKRQDWEKDFDTPKIAGFSAETREIAVQTSDKAKTNLVAINVDTGRKRIMARGNSRTLRWTLNHRFEPILRFDRGRDEAEEIVYSRTPDGNWVPIERVNKIENEFVPNTESSATGELLVMHRPEHAERSGLYEYDLSTNSFGQLVFEHPEYDLVSIRGMRDTTLLYAAWLDDRIEKHWFHPEFEPFGRMLDKAFKAEDNWIIVETSENGRQWLIFVSSPTRPGTWFHFNTETKKARSLIKTRPSLNKDILSPVQRIDYNAQDGLNIFGYFTPSKRGPNSPLIVMPHGGPVSRDYADFDGYVQFLAFKGYHVFQPQFRGGGGMGQTFEKAGHGQWGKAMQTDIEDGVTALVETGLVHPEAPRSILGISYGGYAALAAASLTPDFYQCAVSINGISNLPLFFQQFDEADVERREVLRIWSERIGDPHHDMEAIKAISPFHNLDKIEVPILLIHGDQDSIVYPIQSERLFEGLKAEGKPVTFHILKDQGHYIWNQDERTNTLVYIDNFLTRCMPAHIRSDATLIP